MTFTTKVTRTQTILKSTCCSCCPYNSKVLFFMIIHHVSKKRLTFGLLYLRHMNRFWYFLTEILPTK